MAIQYSRATEIMETHRFLIASTADQWADFLRGSCRFESYSFENQIMILAQRVNPTAVASYEHWNTVQECSVIKGRKGIALFNEYGTGLRYVFDAADVREIHDKNKNGHKPVLWTMEERHRDIVLTGLQERYGSVITATDDFEDRVKAYINAAVGEFILSEPEYLDMGREVQALIFSSVEFAVLNRMGLSPAVMDYPAFDNISKYAMNEEILHAIGNATQKVSGSMLREIGRDINRYDMERVTELGIEGIYTARKGLTDQFIASLENSPVNGLANASQEVHNAVEADKTNDTMEGQNNAGRTDIHESRGLSVSEHYSGSAADRAADQVRENADRIHEGTQADSLLNHEDERDTGIPLSGDSGTGGGDAEESHGTDDEGREDNRGTERDRSAGMDRSHEQNNGSSGRTSASERGLQLEYIGENLVYEQMSLFAPDEMEQIGSIMAGGSHSFEPVPAEYELSRHHLEDLLRTGSGRDDSRHRIWNQFSIGKSPEEIINFLRKEYRQCGKGFTIDGHNISIYAEKEGIRFGFGESAYEQPINIRIGTGRGDIINGLLPWENVENILRHMVREGSYLSTSEAYMTPEIERKRVARMISSITSVLVVNDGSGRDHEMEPVSVLPEKVYGEERNNLISELLSTPQGIQTIHSRLLDIISQKERGEIIQRFRNIYSLEGAVSEVEDMMRDHTVFPTMKEVEVRQEDFITQDEIDSCLGSGSGFEHGSFRIYDYFMEGHDSKEAAKFLKNEYGIGGSSSAIAGTEHSWQNHDAKGIRLDKGRISSPYTSILLPWKAVEKRIRKLIEEDKYLSPSGKEFYAKYKEEQAQKALEQEQAKIEREIKVACKDAIERAITEKLDVDGVHLLEDTAEAVIKEYGIERVTYVLANTVAHNRQDEHFSEENREWSKEIEPYAMWKNSDLVASSHPAAINSFINQTRRYIEQEKEKEFKNAEPTVTIVWSENSRLHDGETMSLSEANALMGSLDEAAASEDRYYKTRFRIDFVMDGQPDHYDGRQDIGDGDGTLIDHIEKYHTAYENNTEWEDYLLRNEGAEALEADKVQRSMLLNDFVPYLKLHNSLSQMEKVSINALQENENMSPVEAAYHAAIQAYVSKCRELVNQGEYDLPPVPQLRDFDVELQAYKEHVEEEIAQEAASAGMTVEEYAANGYEPYTAETQQKLENTEDVEETEDTTLDWHIIHEADDDNGKPTQWSATLPNGDFLWIDAETEGYALYNTEKTDAGYISISPTLNDAKADGENYAAELFDREAAASLVSERNREALEKIVVGSRITLPDGEWEVKRLDGDFILSMDNIDKNSQTATRSMVGAWKEQLLQEAGNNPISVFSPGFDNEKAPEQEQKLTVTLTVAECREFHTLGEYHEGIPTVDEAIAIYNRIPPERMNGIPSIGIRLHTIGSEDYEDVEADLLSGEIIDLEILDYIPDITGSKEAMALIAELIKKVPDAEIRGSLDKWLPQEDAALNAAEDLPETADNIQIQTVKAHNFHITDDALGAGGAKEKFERNIHAIETLKRIEAENRDATREEQLILSQYVGWGGLSDAFDANKPNWSNEYNRLQSVLTAEEYAAARRSTLDAFYTSPVIIREIYQKMADMGFEGGNILEPSCAIGNFFGMMPEKMQQTSKLFGVELDSVSGRIAKKLYPDADISISGYENASLSDDFFDIAVGNVPFGEIRPYDKTYAKENFLIHDYFFAKTLDKVRAGGVIAFITSKGTLDKQSDDVRRYIAERAEFLGAVRLPDTAFKANAGTEVTSDIIFLQKRDETIQLDNDNLPSWCSLSADENGISLNKYFAEHPEQICGSMKMVSGPFGPVSTCTEDPSRPLSDQLKEAMSNIHGVIDKSFVQIQTENNHETHTLPADDQVRNYSYAVVDDRVYYRSSSVMEEVNEKPDVINRIKDMCAIRDAVQDVLNIQIEDPDNEAAFKEKQGHLNAVYDTFAKKYGRIGSRTNKRAFEDDASYCLLRSLEKYDDDGNFKEKSAIFTKRTVKPIIRIESCENSLDALFASLSEKAVIDFDYMSSLCGRTREEMLSDLTGIIFQNPETNKYETAEEYLSGNVRKKLEFAQDMVAHGYEEYAVNVKHLEQVQPEKLKASEIAVRLGATWIEPEYINQFMKETFEMPERLFQKPYYWRQDSLSECGATMNEYTNEWTVRGKRSYNNAIINSTYGSSRRNALLILEDSLNLRDSRVYDVVIDPATQKERRILNQKETIIVQQKQELLKEKFKDWIFADPDRREYLVEKYNTLFNSIRPRTYDGSHLTFNGIANGITLNPHQKDAIARVLYGGNTLLAHAVGAGKTYEMVAAAMESKRLGLCNKSLFVVPNHLTEQWGASFMKLYPNANILVATKKDFEPANRKEFCSRIATGDYDAVIIGHTQFERIPLSPERIAASMDKQISDIQSCIDATLASEGKKSPSVKQLEKQKQTLERRIKELNDAPKDDVVTFEQLGVDRLFVDESHNFKNLFTYTKMRNVGGISTTEAKKSTDLYQKCQYLDDITGGKGIIFASGTPISNSMTELFTNMRYLQSEKLRQMNLQNFDAWASTFGETQTAMELAPEGTGYRSKTRFAKFFNLPELMNIFKEVADVKTSDMLDLDVPEAVYEDVVTEPSQYQKDIVLSLADRAEAVRGGSVDRHNDNMLKITNDGRMAALDQRLINPMLPDDPNSKANHCVEKSFEIWNETKADKLTQVIFCDLSTPSKDGRFNVYDDIKKKLIEKGVPEKEIAFIHDADTEVKKANLFAKVRSGEVRFILGSTPKLGAGTNIQHKLTALHHLDVPWRPSDIEQQEGRIIRQHNSNDKVKIFRYITKDTFDAYSWQLIENKQKFIGQIMTSKSPVRMADDVDEQALNYAEIKALATGNPLIKEKMDLDVQVNKLKMLKGAYQSSIFQMQDNITKILPQRIARNEEYIADLKKDMAVYAEKKAELMGQQTETLPLDLDTGDKTAEKDPEKEPFKMEVCGVTYDSRGKAGEALIAACRDIKTADTSFEIGEFCGFKMNITFDALSKRFVAGLKGNRNYVVDLDSSAIGNTIRIKNTLENLGRELDNAQKRLADAKNELETAQREVSKPFPKEGEYQEKMLRLLEVNRLLEQGDKSMDQDDLTQLTNNIDYVVDSYLNQISDFGDPLLSEEELLDMCKAEIFDIMADGMGSCKEEKGICDRLRSLGDDVIAEKIMEHGREILNTENQERSISLSSMKKEAVEKKSADQSLHEPTTLQKQTVL